MNFLAFITKYFAGTGVKLENPPPDGGEEPLDKATFKILEGIVAK